MLFVWFNWTGTSSAGISHAAVITKVSGSNIYVTQHSHTRINEPIWKVTDALSWQAALTCPCGPPSPPNSDEVDAMRRLLTTGPVALLACVFLAGCSTKGPHLPDYVVLSKHVTHGVRWQLDAYLSDDGLCLTVDDPRGPEVSGDWSSGGCGFDSSPSGGYWSGGQEPGDENGFVVYGPLPDNATAIRVASHTVVKTIPFPRGSGLPTARYWFVIEPPGWPSKADGTLLSAPQPLDKQGKNVTFKKF
ncbi:hypothetical protein OHV08_00480 [Streptomyces canus]|uniref:hypothetical protein n=1 Tax=Streptomyces canus TaxID=58343 RepID=UPI0032518228